MLLTALYELAKSQRLLDELPPTKLEALIPSSPELALYLKSAPPPLLAAVWTCALFNPIVSFAWQVKQRSLPSILSTSLVTSPCRRWHWSHRFSFTTGWTVFMPMYFSANGLWQPRQSRPARPCLALCVPPPSVRLRGSWPWV